jgi:hypothetical protein
VSGVSISIRVRAGALAKNFGAFVDDAKQGVKSSLRKAAERAIEIVTSYPDVYRGGVVFKSDKQRAFVMINIALGNIIVPRVRTGAFGESFGVVEYSKGVKIISSYPNARYVVGTAAIPQAQSYMHTGRWTPLRTAVETAVEDLPVELEESVLLAKRREGFVR